MTFLEAKAANPRMRRRKPVGIISSGSHMTIIHCCLCGAEHSYATGWPQPKHAKAFRAYHDSEACQREVDAASAGAAKEVGNDR